MAGIEVRHDGLLSAAAPYEWDASLRALSGFAPSTRDHTVSGRSVRKALVIPGCDEAAVVEVAPRPDDQPGVALRVYARRPLSAAEAAGLERATQRWLGLDDDLAPFLARAADDPVMAPVLAEVRGLHQVRFASLAEGATFFVLTHRASQRSAAARKRRLAGAYGPRLTVDGVEHVAFPSLARLAEVPPGELAPYTANPRQTETLRTVVSALAELDEEWLRSAPYDEVRAALLTIRGVGPFTAGAILLRVLGRPDSLPLEMAQFADIVAALYGAGTPVEAVRQRYGRHIGWWGYFAKTALAWRGLPTTHSTARRRIA